MIVGCVGDSANTPTPDASAPVDGSTSDVVSTPDADADAPLVCDAGTACSGVCVDTTTSDDNCGGCGQKCNGAKCFDSVCNGKAIVQVAASASFGCVLRKAGQVLCFGRGEVGQLGADPSLLTKRTAFGESNVPSRETPTEVAGIDDAIGIATGYRHACAIRADKTVVCWGANDGGQLGHASAADPTCGGVPCKFAPSAVAGLADVKALALGYSHSCALTTQGAVKCWGHNGFGQIGNGTVGGLDFGPTQATNLTAGVVAITSGPYHTACALLGGKVYCWGANFGEGALGHDPSTDPLGPGSIRVNGTPTAIALDNNNAAFTGVTSISLSQRGGCGVRSGAVWCWGWSLAGRKGINAADDYRPSFVVNSPNNADAVVEGVVNVYARDTGGALWSWGQADIGTNGVNGLSGTTSCAGFPCSGPTIIPSLSVQQVSCGLNALALTASGKVVAWGANGFGSLGHAPNTSGDVACGTGFCGITPVEVTGL